MNGYICSREDFDKIASFFERMFDKIVRRCYNLKNGLRNLWKWRSVVWNDRPWDYVYILHALRFKLDETQRCIDGSFVGSDEEAAKIRSIMEALDRIIEDDYVSEESKAMDEKYGELSMSFKDDHTVEIKRENLKDEDKEAERQDTIALAILEGDRQQRDIDFVFDAMKDIQRWWV